jgi:hypothetical protein
LTVASVRSCLSTIDASYITVIVGVSICYIVLKVECKKF